MSSNLNTVNVQNGTPEIDGSSIYEYKTVLWKESASGAVIVKNSSNLRSYILTTTSSIVWNLFDGNTTVDEIIKAVLNSSDAQLEITRADIIHIFKNLESLGLITKVKSLWD